MANIGWNRSSGGPYFSYGLKQDGSADWKSTFANFSGKRTYAKLDEDSFSMGFAPAQNTAVDSVVTNVLERVRFNLEGNTLYLGDTDNVNNPDSGARLEMGSRISNGASGSASIDLINGSFSQSAINFKHGQATIGGDIATPRAAITSSYTGNANDYNLQLSHYNGSTLDNYMSMRADYTYFNKPLRIGANAAANELDDYEEGTWTPTIFGYFGGMTNTTYTNQHGTYTKIGNLVRAFCSLTFTSTIGTSGNTIYISGLPFTPEAGGAGQTRNFLFSVGYKENVDFVYNAGFGRVSLSVIGARKFISNNFTINCDDGFGIDNLTTDALKGSSSSSMTLAATVLYKVT